MEERAAGSHHPKGKVCEGQRTCGFQHIVASTKSIASCVMPRSKPPTASLPEVPTNNTLSVLSHMASVWALLVKTCHKQHVVCSQPHGLSVGSPCQDLSKHTEAEESPWIGLPSVRPAHRNSSLVIRMQLTAPWRVPLRSAYPTAPKAKAVKDHFLCSRMLCLAEFASDTSKANFASGELPSPGYL